MENKDITTWLEEWYQSQCNGDWEHSYGVKIETLDNPGWSITIDLKDSTNKLPETPFKLIEKSEDDWYGYKIEDMKYSGVGDPTKLKYLLELFQQLISEAA